MLQYIEKQTTKQLVFTNSVFHCVSIMANKLDKSPHTELIIITVTMQRFVTLLFYQCCISVCNVSFESTK